MTPERIGAFVEYILRPICEDIRVVCEKLKELNLPLSEETVRRTVILHGRYHLIGELIRAVCYLSISALVCLTCVLILS